MNINFQESEVLSPFINNYFAQSSDSLTNLSTQLKNVDIRIKFEEWLINNFSPEDAIDTDYEWHSKVITMLVTNLTESKVSDETRRTEDLLLARLISKASPLPKQDQGILDKGARLVHHAAWMILNSKQIFKELKNANLPFTNTVLLRRMQEYQDIPGIMGQAIKDNNISMVKAIIQQHSEEFKTAIIRQVKPTDETLVYSAVANNRIEILKIMAKAAPESFSKALIWRSDENTPIDNAVANDRIEILKFMAEVAPVTFSNALTSKNSNDQATTPLLWALYNGSIELVKLLADTVPEAFKTTLTLRNNDGKTHLYKTVEYNRIERLKKMAEASPEGFSEALILKNDDGDTPVSLASHNNLIPVIKIMAEAGPKAFSAALTLKNDYGNTPVYLASLKNNIDTIKFMAEASPEAFSAALMLKNIDGDTPVYTACYNNDIDMANFMAETAPEAFSAALILKNNAGYTPVAMASFYNYIEIIKLMAEASSKAFSAALTLKDEDGDTPVSLASSNNDIDMIKFMAEATLKEFSDALTVQNNFGSTPVSLACYNNCIDIAKFMREAAPEAFSAALMLKNIDGNTPVYTACYNNNIDMANFLAEIAPDSLILRNISGDSGLEALKMRRLYNDKKITGLFNLKFKKLNKEIVNRVALSHAYDISGTSRIIANDTKTVLADHNLEGGFSPQWFHILGKDINEFMSSYPDLMTNNEMILLKDVFHVGANPGSYSLEEKLQRIKDGKPTFIDTGFFMHSVTLLIWGDHFVICNRGGASRKPVEFFHFDPQKIDLEDLEKITVINKNTSKDSYKKLFFEELSTKLVFSKTPVDLKLEQNNNILPDQIVGNCSFVSPITAVYALRLLAKVLGVDLQQRLLDETHDVTLLTERIMKTTEWYQTWLSFEQITILERNIQPIEKGILNFEPDHSLFAKCLHKAILMPLDDLCSQKLKALAQIYLISFEKNEQTVYKNDSDLILCNDSARLEI